MKKLILTPFFLIFASADNSIVLLNEEIRGNRYQDNSLADCYITCWGDSLTSMGGLDISSRELIQYDCLQWRYWG